MIYYGFNKTLTTMICEYFIKSIKKIIQEIKKLPLNKRLLIIT